MNKYLIRLDDACPTMDRDKWQRMFELLDRYGIKPMVGVIPHNEDPKQMIDAEDPMFWLRAKEWERKGYAIALHGYNHCYMSDKGLLGLNPLWARSEFAGVAYSKQCQKIHDGFAIMTGHGLKPKYFFAPSHTFDEVTLRALREYTDIRIISDTIGNKPYKIKDFIFIPQLGGHCMKMNIPGVWTFCLHPSMMEEEDFRNTEKFLVSHQDEFVGFDELDFTKLRGKGLIGKMLSWVYFARRKYKGIK